MDDAILFSPIGPNTLPTDIAAVRLSDGKQFTAAEVDSVTNSGWFKQRRPIEISVEAFGRQRIVRAVE